MQVKEQEFTVIDGFKYDNETGECLGSVDPWVPTTKEEGEQVMERIFNADAALESLVAQKKALIANMDQLIKRAENTAKSLRWFYGPSLEIIAHQNRGKLKSWDTPYGGVAFRTVPASVKVSDEKKVKSWAMAWAPESIETKQVFHISKVEKHFKEAFINKPDHAHENGFDVIPASECMTIKTGVGK